MQRVLTILLLSLASIGVVMGQSQQHRREYIKKYSKLAITEMRRSGVPASISLAQGILESNSGQSTLATKAKNHFGIKCHDWKGKEFYMDDDAPNECFRVYKTVDDSWRDHSNFLREGSRYSSLFTLDPTDYKSWAKGLKKAGYATAPDYAERLIEIIEDEKLYVYDRKGASAYTGYAPGDPTAYPNRVEVINGVECIEAWSGDSFAKIAEFYDMKLKKLLKYNDKSVDNLAPGDIVYLSAKKKRAAKGYPYCRVRENTSLYNISQQYGVKLKSLIRYNSFTPESQLTTGEKVYLRNKPAP